MARQAESLFKERVKKDLFALGVPIKIFTIQQLSIRGYPDLIVCLAGIFVALELKRSEKAKRAELQIFNLDETNSALGYGFVAYPENWASIVDFLKTLVKGENPCKSLIKI